MCSLSLLPRRQRMLLPHLGETRWKVPVADALTLDTWELIGRVLLAALLGGIIGVEREFSDQPAGFRTHILVSLGAALFTLAGAYGFESFFEDGTQIRFDPTRVAAQ